MSHDDAVLVVTTSHDVARIATPSTRRQACASQPPGRCRHALCLCLFWRLAAARVCCHSLLFCDLGPQYLFASACIITGSVLFFMGAIKSWFTTQHWIHAGTETLLLGGACATVAYTIGHMVEDWVNGGGSGGSV
jgi:hypothetical protein